MKRFLLYSKFFHSMSLSASHWKWKYFSIKLNTYRVSTSQYNISWLWMQFKLNIYIEYIKCSIFNVLQMVALINVIVIAPLLPPFPGLFFGGGGNNNNNNNNNPRVWFGLLQVRTLFIIQIWIRCSQSTLLRLPSKVNTADETVIRDSGEGLSPKL